MNGTIDSKTGRLDDQTIRAAAEIVRERLKAHDTFISIVIYTNDLAANETETVLDIWKQALAHNGNPDEGDYLRGQIRLESYGSKAAKGAKETIAAFSYDVTYDLTCEQEQAVTAKVADILSSLNLNNKSDYEKIYEIYSYVCSNVVFDESKAEDYSTVDQNSAYSALCGHKAISRGFATALYRLLTETGIECRVVLQSIYNTNSDAWNIVKLNGKYYYLDAANDSGKLTYTQFLKGSSEFYKTTLDDDYVKSELSQISDVSYCGQVDAVYSETKPGANVISWTPVFGASKYMIQRRYYDGSKWKSWGTVSSSYTGTTYEDTNISSGVAYQYRICAYNGEWSDFTKVEITASTVPVAPQNLIASAEPGKNAVTWTAVKGATKYLIQRRYYDGSKWKSWGTVSTANTGTTYEDTGISAGVKYQYRVYAYNGEWSAYSLCEVTASLIPAAPEKLTAKAEPGKNVITWTAVKGATKYLIQRRYYDGSKWKSWGTVSSTYTGTTYEDKGISAGVKYQYRVYAYNGEWSAYTLCEVTASLIPAAPENLTTKAEPGKNTLTWTAVKGATKYLIQRRYYDGSKWKSWGTLSSAYTGTTYEDTGVAADVTYQYRVYAYNGEWSAFTRGEVVSSTTPPAPASITAASEQGKVVINWSSVSGATQYLLQKRSYNGTKWNGWSTVSSTLTGTSYEDSRVTEGVTYQYRVYAYNGEWSSAVKTEIVAGE